MMQQTSHEERRAVSMKLWILSCLFGIGSWIALNGIWVELPNLINHLPEGWRLPSYMAMIVQIANIGPITYALMKKHCFGTKEKLFEHATICFILICGVISCGLLTGFWDKTTYLFGTKRSVALLVLTFLVSLLDCTSSVTFLPFMSQLPVLYMSPFFIGENMSSLVCALIGLGQGVEVYNGTSVGPEYIIQSPRFSQDIFFVILSFLTLVSFTAYMFLHYRNKHVMLVRVVNDKSKTVAYATLTQIREEETTPLLSPSQPPPSSFSDLWAYFVCMFWLNFLQNGVTSSIGSYIYAPYGEVPYHLASTLGPIFGSMACLMFMFRQKILKSHHILFGTLLYTLAIFYQFAMATMSPHPVGYDRNFGKIIIVVVCVVSSILVSYTKLAIACKMRHYGHQHLFYTGAVIQVGSFLGALIMFPIVNYTKLFTS